jgi:hypothetical protein
MFLTNQLHSFIRSIIYSKYIFVNHQMAEGVRVLFWQVAVLRMTWPTNFKIMYLEECSSTQTTHSYFGHMYKRVNKLQTTWPWLF